MKRLTRALAAGGLMLGHSLAVAATIGFDSLDASSYQPVPLTTFTEDGFTFSVSTGGSVGAGIFDTNCAGYGANCNGDDDLVPATQGENGIGGNVLILNNGKPNPNDYAEGGTITLTVTAAPNDFFFKGFSAIDDTTFTAATNKDGVLGTINLENNNDTGRVTFRSSLLGAGDQIILTYEGSGGIDSLQLTAVPIPAAAWLFGSALAGMMGIGYRRSVKKV